MNLHCGNGTDQPSHSPFPGTSASPPICFWIILLLTGCCLHSFAQANSWTNSGSGNWEQNFWSLGVLPGTNQSVMLTNSGWKAVMISSATVSGYPQTLTPGSITISSP